MTLIEALADLVEEAEAGFARADGNVTLEVALPPMPNRAVRLKLYGGRMPRGTHDIDGPAYLYPRCQVLVRGEPQQALGPEQDAYALYYALSAVRNRTVNGVRLVAVDALDYPVLLEVDSDKRRSYIFNLEVNEGRV